MWQESYIEDRKLTKIKYKNTSAPSSAWFDRSAFGLATSKPASQSYPDDKFEALEIPP